MSSDMSYRSLHDMLLARAIRWTAGLASHKPSGLALKWWMPTNLMAVLARMRVIVAAPWPDTPVGPGSSFPA